MLEEVGVKISTKLFFGSTETKSEQTTINKSLGIAYPNPGFIPHCLCSGEPIKTEIGEEVRDIITIPFASIDKLDELELPERAILEIGLATLIGQPELSANNREELELYLENKNFNLELFKALASNA